MSFYILLALVILTGKDWRDSNKDYAREKEFFRAIDGSMPPGDTHSFWYGVLETAESVAKQKRLYFLLSVLCLVLYLGYWLIQARK